MFQTPVSSDANSIELTTEFTWFLQIGYWAEFYFTIYLKITLVMVLQTGVWNQAPVVTFLSLGPWLLTWTQKPLSSATKWKYDSWDSKKNKYYNFIFWLVLLLVPFLFVCLLFLVLFFSTVVIVVFIIIITSWWIDPFIM